MMYSFEVWGSNKKKAKVCINTDESLMGFVGGEDDVLNSLLTVITNAPYLITNTGGFKNASYIGLKERITIKDERFFNALKSQLFPYELKNRMEIKDKTIEDVLKEGIS